MRRIFWLGPLFLFSCAHHSAKLETRAKHSAPRLESSSSTSCRPLSANDRQRLLEIADPKNFPRTRYRRGPSSLRGIEAETDCSHFVHEVYRRAGLRYGFRATRDLRHAEEFDLLPEEEAQPGDLMLFRGHVGLVDESGQIISALRTRRGSRKSSIGVTDRRHFRTFRGQRYVLRYRCGPTASNFDNSLSKENQP